MKTLLTLGLTLMLASTLTSAAPPIAAVALRCENLTDPLGIDVIQPRLSWRLEASGKNITQAAYRILVASSAEVLAKDQGDLWDSGKIETQQTREIHYEGKPLTSRTACFWKVMVWDNQQNQSAWSSPAKFSMGLLAQQDWKAQWISYKDTSPLHTSRKELFLPPARYYAKLFAADKPVKRATAYASALGNFDLLVNAKSADKRYFAPGWADYLKRAFYVTYDITPMVKQGNNYVDVIVTDGWYAGYVGYGLLVGYGPNKAGRYFYGKTPALLVQIEIEYQDGSTAVVGTDTSWKVTGKGPIREADIIMGEMYDARLENAGKDDIYEPAILASDNGSTKAKFSDNTGTRDVELGFSKPPVMQAYNAPPIVPTQEIKAVSVKEHKPGVFIFDLGQQIAGVIRLNVKGAAGTKVQIRYAEMLHSDGRMMTENLRRARATDFYICKGDAAGETWTPRFTYHGFRYVELTGLTEKPSVEAVTGIVLHNDTPLTSSFECSDPMANRLFQNIVWTQRANFIEIPTDCPQRDERLGWMGDAQIYVRSATYNADVQAFFTKWIADVVEAQRDNGAYPDYAPYPMGHGQPGKTFGTAWTDAGIICPWTIWKVYNDTEIIRRHYDSMTKFMEFRIKSDPDLKGVSIGNPWGDWLNMGENTPVEYVDLCYFAQSASMMADMAAAIARHQDANRYRELASKIAQSFRKNHIKEDGTFKVDTQSAYVLAFSCGVMPFDLLKKSADRLAEKIAKNGFRMSTGFLGTKPLLPVLTGTGHHDLAVRLFQSRKFPSWGYEVENGATTVWERWDSYTKEHGFDGVSGKNNAAMNSFAHYAFGGVCEWMFQSLVGIDTDGPGHQRLIIRPGPPTPGSNPDNKPIDWVKAHYDSPNGRIICKWKREQGAFELELTIPPNTSATVYLPAAAVEDVTESDLPLRVAKLKGGKVATLVGSGSYRFLMKLK